MDLDIHYIAKSIGSPPFNERFDYHKSHQVSYHSNKVAIFKNDEQHQSVKKMSEWICIIVEWLCLHTTKTHLYANEDILHPISPLKLKYYNLDSSDEGFWKSDSNQC